MIKNRVAVFAHYDRDHLIDNYVVEYIKRLKAVADDVIFVSDGDLSADEKKKVSSLTLDIIAENHGEYDFGSYKRGFYLLKEKYKKKFSMMDELIFANDSCYAINRFDLIFNDMADKQDVDAWGMTDNDEIQYHLQSYFLVFRRSVFLEPFFERLMSSVKRLQNKAEIIRAYEVGFANALVMHHKKIFAYFGKAMMRRYLSLHQEEMQQELIEILGVYRGIVGVNKLYKRIANLRASYCRRDTYMVLVRAGYPLLKREVSSKNILIYFGHKILSKYASYDVNLLNAHRLRVSGDVQMPPSKIRMLCVIVKFIFKNAINKI